MTADQHPQLVSWWKDDPSDPDRPRTDDPDVRRLADRIAPGSTSRDLGDVMSFSLALDSNGLVLRVHQSFVSRARLLALQQVRTRLAETGLIVPVAREWRGSTLFRCPRRWAELESFIPNTRLPVSWDSHEWLFERVGDLHRALASIQVAPPRPLVATWATPRSPRQWPAVTHAAVRHDSDAAEIARQVRELVRRLERIWVPPARLPAQLIHGDPRLSNIRRKPMGEPVSFDFGFAAVRPRVHGLAYAIAFVIVGMDAARNPQSFAWEMIPRLITTYERAAPMPLQLEERAALPSYALTVLLYHAALDGFTANPVESSRSRLSWIHLAGWLLDHRDALGSG